MKTTITTKMDIKKEKCGKCNKELTLSPAQISKKAWGQKKFYHKGCFRGTDPVLSGSHGYRVPNSGRMV